MNKNSKILIVGYKSMLGNALADYFKTEGFKNILSEVLNSFDLMSQSAVNDFFAKEEPEFIFMTDVRSGGIVANLESPAEFIYTNLQVQNNIIHAAYEYAAEKLLFLGSSCGYPKDCQQPIKEEYFLGGKIEESSAPYAVSKIAGIKMCQAYQKQYGVNFICAVPATVYGGNDDFDLKSSHVISALIRKFHEAKLKNEDEVSIWGTGNPKREFLYIDDMVKACVFLMNNYKNPEIINVGYGEDISIKELAKTIKDVVGFKGKTVFDSTKPDGAMRKLLDSTKIFGLGWSPKINLKMGIERTYKWYKEGVK
ncbi:MAG: GDP-L-fucose synthase [Candidatus Omnitrophica bacterium]|nr:GDP-L-fucose synthase [Candidatus Omnitrophota bacterium]